MKKFTYTINVMLQWQKITDKAIKREVRAWFALQCKNPLENYYCYYYPASDESLYDFDLRIVADPDTGNLVKGSNFRWQLLLNEKMLKGESMEYNAMRLQECIRRAPLYIVGEV